MRDIVGRLLRIKADLQIHSVCSDGSMGGEEIVRRALIRGLRAIAVTDHNTFSGYWLAVRAVERIGASIVVIPGNEVKTSMGDLIVLCEKPSDRVEGMVRRSPEEVIEVSREEGCISYAPHPFDIRRLGLGKKIYGLKLDAIEIFNSLSDPLSNRKAREARERLGLPGLSDSDAHIPSFVGVAHNIIEISDLKVESILESIRKGMVEPVEKRPGPVAYIAHVLRTWLHSRPVGCDASLGKLDR
ncbi:MAG TPA: PHP domain-containing protein [Sulfolobales archaeon]|nr:PHP domain-containing protein [Sulfolobales archaeon]